MVGVREVEFPTSFEDPFLSLLTFSPPLDASQSSETFSRNTVVPPSYQSPFLFRHIFVQCFHKRRSGAAYSRVNKSTSAPWWGGQPSLANLIQAEKKHPPQFAQDRWLRFFSKPCVAFVWPRPAAASCLLEHPPSKDGRHPQADNFGGF